MNIKYIVDAIDIYCKKYIIMHIIYIYVHVYITSFLKCNCIMWLGNPIHSTNGFHI